MKVADNLSRHKSHMCSKFGQSGLLTFELLALIAENIISDLLAMLNAAERSLPFVRFVWLQLLRKSD